MTWWWVGEAEERRKKERFKATRCYADIQVWRLYVVGKHPKSSTPETSELKLLCEQRIPHTTPPWQIWQSIVCLSVGIFFLLIYIWIDKGHYSTGTTLLSNVSHMLPSPDSDKEVRVNLNGEHQDAILVTAECIWHYKSYPQPHLQRASLSITWWPTHFH